MGEGSAGANMINRCGFVRKKCVSMVQMSIHCQLMYLITLSTVIIFFAIIPTTVAALRNPYEVLGVKQSASITEIKHQYKQLVRNWHPDKNSDPEAEAKFIEINKAYGLLSDPERRIEFDRFGSTEDTPNFRSRADYSSFKRFEFDPFDSMFSSYSSYSNGDPDIKFQFNPDQGTLFRKQSVTIK